MITYLNEITEKMCLLYYTYKDNLIFSEDKLLEVTNRAKFVKERDYDDLSFPNYVLTAFSEKTTVQK